MKTILLVIFVLSLLNILMSNLFYGLSIDVLHLFYKKRKYNTNGDYKPTLTVMIVAHNEEKVIKDKLLNILQLNYYFPFSIIVTSDNSTDKTNEIVKKIISENPDKDIKLYEVQNRQGKTNAQNEAQKLVDTEILVMSDANAILDSNALIEIVKLFYDKNVSYVCGQLKYVNSLDNITARNENLYWKRELSIRNKESKIKSITAGNGALYAVKNDRYYDFNPISSHDSAMPIYYVSKKEKALYQPTAIAYEKAGEKNSDEFKRKVRMNREVLKGFPQMLKMINIFKYGIYSYLYIGHRSSRSLLWLSHLLLLISNIYLSIYNNIFLIILILHILFYLFAVLGTKIKFIMFSLPYYYTITIVAQLVAVKRGIFRQNKPFWEKAESTR